MNEAKKALIVKFAKVAGYEADKRWSFQTLLEKVEAYERKAHQMEKMKKNAAAKLEAKKKEQEKTAQERGTADEYLAKPYSQCEHTLRHLCETIELAKTSYENSLKSFNDRVVDYPLSTLEWSEDLFANAAMYEYAKAARNMFNEGMSAEEMKEFFNDKLITKAKFPHNSTSQTANLVDKYETIAIAKFAAIFIN